MVMIKGLIEPVRGCTCITCRTAADMRNIHRSIDLHRANAQLDPKTIELLDELFKVAEAWLVDVTMGKDEGDDEMRATPH